LGGIERGSGRSFMVEVLQRNAATLLPIINHTAIHTTWICHL
jgi:hypothetical protein